MKFVLILSVLTVVCAIRVPTSWDEVRPRDVTRTPYQPRPKKPYHHSEPTRRYNERPTLSNYRKNQHFYVNKHRVNKPPPNEHQMPQYRKRRPDFKPNDWTPIFPKDYYGPPKKYQYEDISDDDEETPHEADDTEEIDEDPIHEKDEDTDYEDSQPVVEKYPIRPHRYAKKYYPKKSIKRSDDVDFEHQDSENEQQDDEDHFVPTQLYTKVRHSENTEHLPFEGNDRLREVIKESKINTIYTEKGSEDSEYDHGDEEKKGEKGESYAEHKIENEPAPKITVVQSGDSDVAGSETRTVTLIETESRVKREATTDKYPYYTDPTVNKNSPLKYSESLDNIPPKTVDDMAFYNQAQNKRNCSEKLPIELIKSNNKTIANITIDIPNEVPKQGDLGDQIDCFKEIYFGQDPLDSPFFQETTVEPIEDLTVQTEVPTNLETNILTDILGHMTSDTTDSEDIENDRNGRALELDNENSTDTNLPESQALILRRRKFRPSRPFVNRLPDFKKTYPRKTTYHPYYEEYVPTSTVLPKYKVVSEVFYKDEIKPNEQLNVFADVINNIHNSSHNDDSSSDYSEPIAVKLNVNRYTKAGNKKIKVPSKKIRIKNVLEDSYLDSYEQIQRTNKFTTTTMKPMIGYKERPKITTHRNNEQLYEELIQSLKNNDQHVGESQNTEQFAENAVVHKVKVRRRNSTTTTTPSTEEEAEEEEDTTKTVLGLLPPEQYNYKTIVKVNHKQSEEIPLNKYLVPGMKPPPKQKVYLYSDFMLLPKNKVRRRQDFYYGNRRGKREANKPAYSEHSRNRGRQEDAKVVNSDDDDDDYVPHRPKNYHYDEKLGKIVYHNVKKEEEEDDEDYEEVEVVTPKPHRQKTTRKPVVITSPKPGEGFMDYVKLLKSNEKYVMIEETTTTEKPSTTAKPFIVTPSKEGPAFVDLLAKLHSNKEYKVIQNPEDSPKKPKPFTKPEVVEEEEEEEEDEEPPAIIQNSRGGENVYSDPSYQIFDIGDFIPKVKSYMPRTSIDYSKYKTIERPNTRHNLSARYNSEESLDDVNTSQVPILSEMSKRSDLVDESTEVVSHTTTTTTEKSLEKTTFKLRGRGRQRARTTSTTTTAAPSTQRTSARLQHEKPKRNYIRRRPSRIKLRTTTDLNLESEADDTPKIVRRRSQNSQPIYVPDDAEEDTASEELDPTTVKPPPSTTKFVKSAKVEVFKKFNPENKHGGNYRKLDVESEQTNQTKVKKVKVNQIKPVERLTDVVAKPYSFYTDPKLPDTINKLKTVEAEEEVDEASTEDMSDYYDDAVQIKFEEEKKEIKEDSKPPKIIKDPSKRLYYYAA